MKIAQICCSAQPRSGGMGRSAYNHTRVLRSAGHDVALLTLEPLPPSSFDAKIIDHKLQLGKAAWGARLKNDLSGVDVVHVHLPFFGVADAVATWKHKNPSTALVATYHMDAVGTGLKKRYMSWWYRHKLEDVLQACDGIAVTSKDYAKASRLAQSSVPIEHCKEIALRADSIFKKGEVLGQPYLLFVGGLDSAHYFKGVDVLLEALKMTSGAHLKIVGDGNKKSYFQKKARSLGLANRVIFLGRVSDEQLAHLYQGAGALVLPSTDSSEAFGIVLIEALCSGTPVIASDLPGVRQVVSQSVAGTLVPPGNPMQLGAALQKAWEHPPSDELRDRIHASATARYRLDTLAEDLLQWYRQAMSMV